MSRAARGLVVGSALFALYASGANGEVGWEDSAFFQLCHALLGVPHGPGFPLYVLLGRVFVWPFQTASALGSNLLSGLALACAGVALLEVILLLDAREANKSGSRTGGWSIAGAVAVVFGWATLPVNRLQAARAEVYTLELFLVLLTCYCALQSRRDSQAQERSWAFALATAWCWGLGMTVHPLITLAGATPWVVYALWRWRPASRLAMLSCCAVLPLSLYLFPILRGRLPGVWAWGDFTSLHAMLDYFTRRAAWAAVVSTDGGVFENLAGWGSDFHRVWPAGLWIPSLLALWWLRNRWAFGISLACVCALVLWAAPYDPANLDLQGYFLPAIALLAAGAGVLAVRGVRFIQAQWPGLSSHSRLAVGFFAVSLAASWPAVALVSAQESCAPSAGAATMGSALDASLPRGATLLVSEDNLLGLLEFEMRTQGFRPDLNVIAVGGLRYPFYRRMLAARLPAPWTATWEFESTWSQDTWDREVRRLLSFQHSGGEWYSQYVRLPGIASEQVSPHGFVQALHSDTALAAWAAGLDFWKQLVASGRCYGPAGDALGRWIFNYGVLALDHGQSDAGWEAMLLAIHQSPEDPESYFLLGQALHRAGRISESVAMLAAAVELAPYRARYRAALANVSPAMVALP